MLCLLILLGIVLSGRTALGTGLQLRGEEPIVLQGNKLPKFIWKNIERIHLYSYNAATNSFQPVPFQIDERNSKLEYFDFKEDNFGRLAGNDSLDAYDEVVFLARDLGDQAPSDQVWPDDLDSKQNRRYQIRVTDPYNGEYGYLYAFLSSTLTNNGSRYISISADNKSVFGKTYRIGHDSSTASGMPDTLLILKSVGGDSINFIARQRLRIYSDFTKNLKKTLQLRLSENQQHNYRFTTSIGVDGNIAADIHYYDVAVKPGPIRIIRYPILYMRLSGNLSGLGNFDTNQKVPIGFIYYPTFYEAPINSVGLDLSKDDLYKTLNNFGPRASRIIFSLVLNDNGKGMRYYTPGLPADYCQLGFKIDGGVDYLDLQDSGLLSDVWKVKNWPGTSWYAVVADRLQDPWSVVYNATLFTLVNMQGSAPLDLRELIMWENYDQDGLTHWGDAALQITKNTDLPSSLNLQVRLRYYPIPDVLNFDQLQTRYNIYSDSLDVSIDEQQNDHIPPGDISDLVIASVQDNQITFNFTAVADDGYDGRPADHYRVWYDTRPPGSDWDAWFSTAQLFVPTTAPKSPHSPDQITLAGLQPDQNYYIFIRVFDESENGSALVPVTFLTTPVELSSFTARIENDRIHLDWTTASESNNLGFGLERRAAAEKTWREIAFIPGAGTCQTVKRYAYEDALGAIGQYVYRLRQCDTNGRMNYLPEITATIQAPSQFALAQNFPNPFNPATAIHFQIPVDVSGRVRLTIHDLLGRQVRTLYDEEARAGFYRLEWDGRDDNGQAAGSGVYFYILRAGSQQTVRKMIKVQ